MSSSNSSLSAAFATGGWFDSSGVALSNCPYLSSCSSLYGLFFLQAAQALEPAALVPVQLLAPGGHVVLVGDPKQLPPTVLSRAAEASNLAQSLFERLQQVGLLVSDLDFGIFRVIPKSSLEC